MTTKDQTHELARLQVEAWLIAKKREILAPNYFPYPPDFVKNHMLEKRFQGHSFDIFTGKEMVEIDDYSKHSKKNQKINDGIVNAFFAQYLKPSYELYRLQKEEIVNEKGQIQPTCADYLRDNLF